jgi:hypothetical protein
MRFGLNPLFSTCDWTLGHRKKIQIYRHIQTLEFQANRSRSDQCECVLGVLEGLRDFAKVLQEFLHGAPD